MHVRYARSIEGAVDLAMASRSAAQDTERAALHSRETASAHTAKATIDRTAGNLTSSSRAHDSEGMFDDAAVTTSSKLTAASISSSDISAAIKASEFAVAAERREGHIRAETDADAASLRADLKTQTNETEQWRGECVRLRGRLQEVRHRSRCNRTSHATVLLICASHPPPHDDGGLRAHQR